MKQRYIVFLTLLLLAAPTVGMAWDLHDPGEETAEDRERDAKQEPVQRELFEHLSKFVEVVFSPDENPMAHLTAARNLTSYGSGGLSFGKVGNSSEMLEVQDDLYHIAKFAHQGLWSRAKSRATELLESKEIIIERARSHNDRVRQFVNQRDEYQDNVFGYLQQFLNGVDDSEAGMTHDALDGLRFSGNISSYLIKNDASRELTAELKSLYSDVYKRLHESDRKNPTELTKKRVANILESRSAIVRALNHGGSIKSILDRYVVHRNQINVVPNGRKK